MIPYEKLTALLTELVHRYKYVLVVVCAGLLLLLWPSGDTTPPDSGVPAIQEHATQTPQELEAALEQILSQAEGVGEVAVRLSISSGERVVYAQVTQSDHDRSYADGFLSEERLQDSSQTQVLDGGAGEEPIVISRQSPTYQGALVVCEGAEVAGVRLRVTQAVASMTGLGADRIVIMKMK